MPVHEQDQSSQHPVTGQIVRTVSGRGIGRVADVREATFCVETDDESIWLRSDAIFNIVDQVVSLVCERDGLQRFKAN